MAFTLGMNGVMNVKAGGLGDGTGMTELTNVRDVVLTMDAALADMSTRAGNGWRQEAAALKTASVEGTSIWDSSDAGLAVLHAAFFGNLVIGAQVLDDNGEGLEGDFIVASFTRNEQLEEGMTIDFTLKPAPGENAPAWATGS